MKVTVFPSCPSGEISAVSSKSAAHRVLICAAFAQSPTQIRCDRVNDDIAATARCLCAMGAKIEYKQPYFEVTPIGEPKSNVMLECGESGSTLRFLLPIIPALGISASFLLEGRLPMRPLSPLYEELEAHGASLSPQGSNPLLCNGTLTGEEYRIRGDVSSQFISGLLFALTFSGKGGRIIIEGKRESEPYIRMTENALGLFGAAPERTPWGFSVKSNLRLVPPAGTLTVEGDWSSAAFPLCMGALGKGEVKVSGLDSQSAQGDRAIAELLRRFGADIENSGNLFTVKGGKPLHGIHIDASQIPDLVPVLAAVASVAEGETIIYNAARLRLKESDRLMTVCSMLRSLGATISQTDDGLIIEGKALLAGGESESFGDHRIAMSAAVAAMGCEKCISILGAECAAKSYPDFWRDITEKLGVRTEMEN